MTHDQISIALMAEAMYWAIAPSGWEDERAAWEELSPHLIFTIFSEVDDLLEGLGL